MSTVAGTPPITIEQYLSFKAPPGFRDELIEGEIVLSPDPKALHQEVADRICTLLKTELKGSVFVARQRTNMQMPQDNSMPSPDVFVIDVERWREAIAQDSYPHQSPQLVVEVISRSNTKKNVNRKIALYLKNGSAAVWIVYPHKRVVDVHSVGAVNVLSEEDTVRLPPPLPQRDVRIAEFFKTEF